MVAIYLKFNILRVFLVAKCNKVKRLYRGISCSACKTGENTHRNIKRNSY